MPKGHYKIIKLTVYLKDKLEEISVATNKTAI